MRFGVGASRCGMLRLALVVLLAAAIGGCLAHERPSDDAGRPATDGALASDALVARDAWVDDAFVPRDVAAADDAWSACRTVRADQWITPTVVSLGQPISVLMRADIGVGCGCVPSAQVTPPSGPTAAFFACDCSDSDPCIDPGYDATFVTPPTTIAEPQQFYHPYPGGRVIVDVAALGTCVATDTLRTITLVSPDEAHTTSTPTHWWVRASGTQLRCCGTPHVMIDATSAPGPRTQIRVSASDCAPDPCDCAMGSPVNYDAYADLGVLAPGDYDVVGGPAMLTLTVP